MTAWSELQYNKPDSIDWLNDRIQPFVIFTMPDGGTVEFPLGVFLLSTPIKRDYNGEVVRDVEAYDGLIILRDDKFLERYTIMSGTTYEKAITDILGSAGVQKINITFPEEKIIEIDKEFEIGATKLSAVNQLLSEINFVPIWVDSGGYYTSYPYKTPSEKGSQYTYSDEELSILIEGVEEELDLFDIPNSWVAVVSNPEKEPMISTKENNNPDSITSIPRRNRKIVDLREIDDIADQETLDRFVERIAFEASQVYGRIKFKTPIMPIHEYYDVIRLRYRGLDIDGIFAESNWSIKLEAGAEMEHEVRKVVDINEL